MTNLHQLSPEEIERLQEEWQMAVREAFAAGREQDLRDLYVEAVRDVQDGLTDAHRDAPRLRWFATLELESATVSDKVITFVWRDPADGVRHGWRWEIAPRALNSIDWRLIEDLETTEPTEPDENGIRWWGVRHLR